METEYSVYLGQEQKNGFTSFLSEQNFFCIVEIFDGYTTDQGEELMSALAEVGNAPFESLINFDASISGVLKRMNVPVDTSVAAGYIKNNVLYLKSVGTGQIYIGRGKVFEKIIGGTNIASGLYKKNDLYMLTSSFFTDSLKGAHHVKSFIHKNPHIREYPELVKETVGGEDDTGAIALFIRMQPDARAALSPGGFDRPATLPVKFPLPSKRAGIIAATVLCVAVLGWSVVSGLAQKGGLSLNKSQGFDGKVAAIETTIESARGKTDAISEGMNDLDNARTSVAGLAKGATKEQKDALTRLNGKIAEAEGVLLNRETKDATVDGDLASEEKGAKGIRFSLFEDKAFVLNPEGSVYIFALGKKSLEKRKLPKKVSSESLVGGYETNAFVLDPQGGIIRIGDDEKSKTVIPKDTQWNTISSMQIYNGNIYLLDGGNNAIYKYAVTNDGYGDKTSYFKGSYLDLDTHSTFAIDVAVYVANSSTVEKYTAGIRDDFSFKIPGTAPTISKIITHEGQTELYVWNKKDGLLYVLDRDGVYKKQIASKALSEASDVEVYNNAIYTLQANLIYSIPL